MLVRILRQFFPVAAPPARPSCAELRMAALNRKITAIRVSELPLQRQVAALTALGRNVEHPDEALCIRSHADFVADVMDNRNFEASRLEGEGETAQAIALYEANLRDGFKGAYPYERLRALYAAAGRLEDALRVCQALLDHADLSEAGKRPHRDWLQRRRMIG